MLAARRAACSGPSVPPPDVMIRRDFTPMLLTQCRGLAEVRRHLRPQVRGLGRRFVLVRSYSRKHRQDLVTRRDRECRATPRASATASLRSWLDMPKRKQERDGDRFPARPSGTAAVTRAISAVRTTPGSVHSAPCAPRLPMTSGFARRAAQDGRRARSYSAARSCRRSQSRSSKPAVVTSTTNARRDARGAHSSLPVVPWMSTFERFGAERLRGARNSPMLGS